MARYAAVAAGLAAQVLAAGDVEYRVVQRALDLAAVGEALVGFLQEGFLLGWDFLYARVRPPARVFWAAVAIAISPEEHWRSIVCADTVTGRPARRAASRPMLSACPPCVSTAPQTTSSTSPRTRAVVVVNPNNPTGSYVRRQELDAIAAVVIGGTLLSGGRAMIEAYERGEDVPLTDVVLSMQKSSLSFEATLQVRNKVVKAYEEILNMPV